MTRRFFPFLLLLVSRSVAQDAASIYHDGVDRQQHGDLAGAVEAYQKLLAIDRMNVAARSNLGAALVGLGRYDDAIPEYQAALKAAPAQVRPLLERNLALAYYKSGRLQDAAPLLVALHEAQPANRDAALLAADCLLQLGEAPKALALLEPLASGADDKAFRYVLGVAYLKSGKVAEAQRVLDPILSDTSSAEGNYALGMAIFTAGDYPAAVKAFDRAIQLNAALPHVFSYYGQALLFTGDADGALTAFGRQLEADRNDFDANYHLALILSRRKRYGDAEPLLRRALLLRPNSTDARLALAEALRGANKTAEARREVSAVVSESPENGAAHALLAEIDAKAGLKSEAARERALAAKYTVAAAAGPHPGAVAPHFELVRPEGGAPVSVPAPGKATVLVFGSYTCPNFRKAAPVLNRLAETYGAKAAFLQVYIREAHTTDQWQSTINEREHVQLAPAASIAQKRDYAMMCTRKLQMRFPSVLDGLDDAAEKAYAAWPSRVYVVSADGRVRYASGLIEEEFDAGALERALQGVLGGAAR